MGIRIGAPNDFVRGAARSADLSSGKSSGGEILGGILVHGAVTDQLPLAHPITSNPIESPPHRTRSLASGSGIHDRRPVRSRGRVAPAAELLTSRTALMGRFRASPARCPSRAVPSRTLVRAGGEPPGLKTVIPPHLPRGRGASGGGTSRHNFGRSRDGGSRAESHRRMVRSSPIPHRTGRVPP